MLSDVTDSKKLKTQQQIHHQYGESRQPSCKTPSFEDKFWV